jgi:hypothetical protein
MNTSNDRHGNRQAFENFTDRFEEIINRREIGVKGQGIVDRPANQHFMAESLMPVPSMKVTEMI